MSEYHKINSLYKRDKQGRFLPGEWSTPEIEYLYENDWSWTEKVDGTNIRIYLDATKDLFVIHGRTDNAQIPTFLYHKVEEVAKHVLASGLLPNESTVLYGEGYGAKIQKGGGNYNAEGVDFVLFDISIDDLWLLREDVEEIAGTAGLDVVPIIGTGSLADAEAFVAGGFESQWGSFLAEGVVATPLVPLADRRGQRIITKLKTKDYTRIGAAA